MSYIYGIDHTHRGYVESENSLQSIEKLELVALSKRKLSVAN